MCWSPETSLAMVGLGTVATVFSVARRDARPIWLALGYFTVIEALQVVGYSVIGQCETPTNRAVTWASYLHIVFQPFIINAFAMELVAAPIKRRVRRIVFVLCGLSAAIMLVQITPIKWAGTCLPGAPLCAAEACTRPGNWHLAWDIPYNGLLVPLEAALGLTFGFPTYMFTVLLVPMLYGAWRFVLLHMAVGPILAAAVTTDPNEMPAIWCLFSVGIILISLVPAVRSRMTADTWWGRKVAAD